jgi:hypothetical protein
MAPRHALSAGEEVNKSSRAGATTKAVARSRRKKTVAEIRDGLK